MKSREKLVALCKGKNVHIATHWDCDGVTSGALLFHLLKPYAKRLSTVSKGDVFLIYAKDCPNDADIIICSDIQPSQELDPNKVIYIDHHPHEYSDSYLLSLHDDAAQSCSMLIWQELLSDTKDPYYLFLVLLGYFGDSGNKDLIPIELLLRAREHFPHLLESKQSTFNDGTYYPIELFVSLFNTGKRMHWSGRVPLELLKSINNYQDITQNRHPLVDELQRYKIELRQLYNMKIDLQSTEKFDYAIIECDKNIQGVICSRYMKTKPIVVLNKLGDKVIASMRVPEQLDFDAGGFLSQFKAHDANMIGGGHEKAGGITFDAKHLDLFVEHLKHGPTLEKSYGKTKPIH